MSYHASLITSSQQFNPHGTHFNTNKNWWDEISNKNINQDLKFNHNKPHINQQAPNYHYQQSISKPLYKTPIQQTQQPQHQQPQQFQQPQQPMQRITQNYLQQLPVRTGCGCQGAR